MLFNSLQFFIFLNVFFLLYWFITHKNLRIQNILILTSSYFFYGWWDWRFLSLIIVSTLVDFTVGILLGNEQDNNKRKILLAVSILVNLGILGYFKYCNFFIENLNSILSLFDANTNLNTLNIILPIGISFYTFQTLSYTIDIYRKELEPSKDIVAFSAFVSFFPQLFAGPIERAKNLLPQFSKNRQFNYYTAIDGLRQILWGFFEKVVIADNCASIANELFENTTNYEGISLVIGTIFFGFQIYGDFSGYSNIAIGIAKLFGFKLMQNFAHPYFSRNIVEFWRRWHISLSNWFKDYVYIPLGGSRGSLGSQIMNIFIVFVISGFWHGANWNYIIWGFLNALLFLPTVILGGSKKRTNSIAEGKILLNIKEILAILTTFSVVSFLWVFFRAENINHALVYIYQMFSGLLDVSNYLVIYQLILVNGGKRFLVILLFFVVLEWQGRNNVYTIHHLNFLKNKFSKWCFYIFLALIIFLFSGEKQEFVYFQF